MFLRRKKFLISLFLFLLLTLYQRLSPQSEQVLSQQVQSPASPTISVMAETTKQEAKVARVIDGDTIEVLFKSKKEKVRVIGIDTPETVDPRRPVECFGKEASNMAKEILAGQNVVLQSDSSQKNVDNYGRLLRYVFIDNIDFGKFMIEQGYAYEYTYDLPYKYQLEYKNAEKQAREEKTGLWKDPSCVKNSS